MHKRLYIFSSKVLHSVVFWMCLAIIGIESFAGHKLSSKFFSHELDHLLWDIEHRTFDADNIILGDSVGRQISMAIPQSEDLQFTPLATSAALEVAGQYMVFQRYLQENEKPEHVILFMRNPFVGKLRKIYTENYIQRCFTRWPEIVSLSWQKRSLSFCLRMITYRLPTAKYRIHINNMLTFLENADRLTGLTDKEVLERKRVLRKKTIRDRLTAVFLPRKEDSISEYYLLKLIADCEERDIQLTFIPIPIRHEKYDAYTAGEDYLYMTERLQQLTGENRNFSQLQVLRYYPDKYFNDGVHFEGKHLPEVCMDYIPILKAALNDKNQ